MKQKITMYSQQTASIQERLQQFLSASSARGFSPKTIQVYQEYGGGTSRSGQAILLPALLRPMAAEHNARISSIPRLC